MMLIPNWRAFPKMWSVRAFLAIGSIQVGLAAAPEALLAAQLPAGGMSYREAASWLTFALTVAGIVLRLVGQGLEPAPAADGAAGTAP